MSHKSEESDSERGIVDFVWKNCTATYLTDVLPAAIHVRGGLAEEISKKHSLDWNIDATRKLARGVLSHLKIKWSNQEHSRLGEGWDPGGLSCELLVFLAGRVEQSFGRLPATATFANADNAISYLIGVLWRRLCNDYRRHTTNGPEVEINPEADDQDPDRRPTPEPPETWVHPIEPVVIGKRDEDLEADLVRRWKQYPLETKAGKYPDEFLYWFDYFEEQFSWLQSERRQREMEIFELLDDLLGRPVKRFPGKRQFVKQTLQRHYVAPLPVPIPLSFTDEADLNEYTDVAKKRDAAFNEIEKAVCNELRLK